MSKSNQAEGFGDSAILDLGEPEGTLHTFSTAPPSAVDQDDDIIVNDDDTEHLLGSDENSASGLKSYSFWSIHFYQQFFDVDTDDVLRRLLWSILPRPGSSAVFFRSKIRSKPDLYGPFWICVTLIFAIAISGNIASYLQTESSFKWHYDFHKVTIVSSAVFGYAWLMPALLFFAVWWLGSKTEEGASGNGSLSFFELLCVYGYSLGVFIPLSVFWIIQVSAVQWGLLAVGFSLSGGVLALTLWPELSKKSPRFGTILILAVILLHFLLACGFMLYFFHAPATVVKANSAGNAPLVTSPPTPMSDTKTKREEKEVENGVGLDHQVTGTEVGLAKPPSSEDSVIVEKVSDPKNEAQPKDKSVN